MTRSYMIIQQLQSSMSLSTQERSRAAKLGHTRRQLAAARRSLASSKGWLKRKY